MVRCHCACPCGCVREPGVFRNILYALGEAAREAINAEDNAKWAKEDALEKYAGTRVVTVALRMYIGFWKYQSKKKYFWYESESRREMIFELAEEELQNDPHAWGPLYRLVSFAQILCRPILWVLRGIHCLIFFLRDKNMFPQTVAYDIAWSLHSAIIFFEQDWNRTPFQEPRETIA